MRVGKWKADEIFMAAKDAALMAIREQAELVASETRITCHENPEVREPRFSTSLRDVSFIPSRGRNKNKVVSFKAQVWLGRKPGDLKATIRTVEKPDKLGNVRVIAGNFKIYWARFAEYGVPSRNIPRSLFMRNAFDAVKPKVKEAVTASVRRTLT